MESAASAASGEPQATRTDSAAAKPEETERRREVDTSSLRKLLLILLAAVIIGAFASVLATLFTQLVEEGQHLVFIELPHVFGLTTAPWWWVAVIVFSAAGLVYLARRLPGATGPSPLTGFHFNVTLKSVPSILLAALASGIGGFALGPEAPLIVLGTAVGALAARGRDSHTRHAFMFIGGSAAIGAIFGNPFITGFMILEFVALGLAPATLLVPIFTALASSYLVSLGIWSIPGMGVNSLAVPGLPAYASIEPGDLFAGAAVAIVAGIAALLARRLAFVFDRLAHRSAGLALFTAAAVTAGLAIIAQEALGLNINLVLFSGNEGMPGLIAETSVIAVIFILIAKGLVFAAAAGGGLRGGPIFPATFLGVAVAVLTSLLLPDASVSALAAAGIAGSAAAFMKLPATSALLGALLISGAGPAIAPFAIFGSIAGFVVRLVADRFRQDQQSIKVEHDASPA